jgi:hypothetical protein
MTTRKGGAAVRIPFVFAVMLLGGLNGNMRAQATGGSCDQTKFVESRVELALGGFLLNFFDRAKPLHRERFLNTRYQAVSYQPRNVVVSIPRISVNNCTTASRFEMMHFKASKVTGLESHGKTFAYLVFAQLQSGSHDRALGGDMNVIFYDMDGSGSFSTVQSSAPSGMPIVPVWAR